MFIKINVVIDNNMVFIISGFKIYAINRNDGIFVQMIT